MMRTDDSSNKSRLDADTSASRSDQVALLSHDIRGTMSDVIGGLRLIDTDLLDPEVRAQVLRVQASGETLARLLEQTISHLAEEANELSQPSDYLNLVRFLHDIESRWAGRASASGLRFTIETSGAMPALVRLERVTLERIIGNILSNAFKYTDKGKVELEVRLSDDRDLIFCVSDNGPGFSDEALAHLFELRGRPRSSEKPGSGLGLHIVKDLSGQLGGELAVDNRNGAGARIQLSVPEYIWQTPQRISAGGALPDLSGRRILVAEDNPTNQMLTVQMLEALQAESHVAEDGIAALEALEQYEFDMALVDIEMPRLNGLAFMREVRARPDHLARIPLVALTAYVLRANREAIYTAGADAIVAKPIVSLERFGETLAQYLDIEGASDAAAKAAQHASAQPLVNRDRLDRLLEIAGPKGADELLKRLSSDLRRVHHNLTRGVAEMDQPLLRAETHVLISLAGAVGAEALHALANRLNSAAHRLDESEIVALGSEAGSRTEALIALVERELADRATAA
jgi:CheY-like chemotaxis protein/two-component sensor histidine kinase